MGFTSGVAAASLCDLRKVTQPLIGGFLSQGSWIKRFLGPLARPDSLEESSHVPSFLSGWGRGLGNGTVVQSGLPGFSLNHHTSTLSSVDDFLLEPEGWDVLQRDLGWGWGSIKELGRAQVASSPRLLLVFITEISNIRKGRENSVMTSYHPSSPGSILIFSHLVSFILFLQCNFFIEVTLVYSIM